MRSSWLLCAVLLLPLVACDRVVVVDTVKDTAIGYDPTDTADTSDTSDTTDTADTSDSADTSDTAVTAPDISVTPLDVNFGVRLAGEVLTVPVTVENVGDAWLDGTVSLVNTDPAFTVDATAVTLDPAGVLVVTVTFAPTTDANVAGELHFITNDPDEPDVLVTLAGAAGVDGDGDGWVEHSDCDDTNPAFHPGADEHCDGLDEDCDGTIDEDPVDGDAWYADLDGDGYGDADNGVLACEQPAGYLPEASDCNDADALVNPGEAELCNGIDDDCNGTVDDNAVDALVWYADLDGDGYGDALNTTLSCEQPAGYLADDTDCDDADAAVNPLGTELCNGIDDDCNGAVDDNAVDPATWYADADGDGYGDSTNSTLACDQPVGYLADDTDCDDADSLINPAGLELCNGLDEDCNGVIDDNPTDPLTWYADADSDGYGDPGSTTTACEQPAGYLADFSDCDDTDATVSPAGTEVCNGIDDDCNGVVDDNATDATLWYVDADGDTYGDPATTTLSCSEAPGVVADSTDCDDTDALVNPAGTELCNGVDDDCNGVIDDNPSDPLTWYADVDGDGYGDVGATATGCEAPAGYVADDTDCDDANAAVNPAEAEICNGVDDDCNRLVDDNAVDALTWYQDADSDTYGNAAVSELSCEQPAGYVADDTDCDDTDASVNPGATEVAYNLTDDNCDGIQDDMVAADETGWTVIGTSASHGIGSTGVWTLDDLNGDGETELVIAAIADDSRASNAGALAFHDNAVSGLGVSYTAASLIVGGEASSDAFGQSMVFLDDVDGDGNGEMASGAYLSNRGDDDGGCVYVFDLYSSSAAYTGTQNVNSIKEGRIEGDSEDGYLGYSLAAGDFDADGDMDLAAGAPGVSDRRGRVYGYVYTDGYTNSDLDLGDATTHPRGATNSDGLGTALAAGDFDGDGTDDLVACAPGYDSGSTSSIGICYFVTGSAFLSADDDNLRDYDTANFTGTVASDALGQGPLSVGAGDLDADGVDDLVLGMPGYDGASSGSGAVLVQYGGTWTGTYTIASVDAVIYGDGALGTAVNLPGDVDGDGQADLLLGAPTSGLGGLVYLASGDVTGSVTLPDSQLASWSAEVSGDALGTSIGGVLDLDADGTLDLAASAPGFDTTSTRTSAGKVYVLPGY
ncbi:hypothetical protein LBMAG42_01150 [Deltaproteobacteria bacterium]|nr:hypothetical protein LBMAG42_01150 [Deltaproteobacteria bacterium]